LIAPSNVLIIDDDPAMRDGCLQTLSSRECRVSLAENGEDGLACLQCEPFDVVLLDLRMPHIQGLDALERIRLIDPEVAVIIITGFATVESAVKAMKRGAFDFIPKPFTPAMLRTVVGRALEQQRSAGSARNDIDEVGDIPGVGTLIGETPVMKRLRRMIRRIGSSGSTVLITGESGTGKELVARALHHHSPRAQAPFVAVDCGCLVESLAEARLFGHVRGAFTGADCTRPGMFEQADRGTILLDEVSNMSGAVQHKLLRVLQEFEITPVGSTQPIGVDVRVIAATNADLGVRVKQGSFRQDLYYRLNVIPLRLPPLRERKEDIPLLAEHFFHRFNRKRRNRQLKNITSGAICLLEERDWPGNVRELENVIERAAVLCDGDKLTEQDFADHLAEPTEEALRAGSRNLPLREAERDHIREVLASHNFNLARTARALQIDRKTLRNKARKYGLLDERPRSHS